MLKAILAVNDGQIEEIGRMAPLHNCHASLINMLKHVRGATIGRPRLTPYIVNMTSVVTGSTKTADSEAVLIIGE